MSKKTIVLADSSYTIRRIVELSFSEEKEIELVTFENSLNLREKLLELQPHIVLVDIKLPEFSGYDVCKFVQETESLAHTRVFLLKGGFEPVDESLLKGLKYVDIITKPFDSNALVANIKKLLAKMDAQTPQAMPDEVPSSFPEDLSEINAGPEGEEDISFSDVKMEIDSNVIVGDVKVGRTPGPYSDEEILPSEEITRAQPDKDRLAPAGEEDKDVDINPFDEEGGETQVRGSAGSLTEEELNIKRNIEFQEKELQIGSLTVEEMNIRKHIEDRQRQTRKQELTDIEEDELPGTGDEDTADMFAGSKLDSASEVLISEAEKIPEEEFEGPEPVEMEAGPGVSTGMEAEMGDDFFAFGAEEGQPEPPSIPETPSFEAPVEEDESLFAPDSDVPEIKYESEPGTPSMMDMEPMEPEPQFAEEEESPALEMEPEPEPPAAETFTTRKMETPESGEDVQFLMEDNIQHDSLKVEYEQEPYHGEKEPESEPEVEPTDFEDFREYEVPPVKEKIKPPSPPPPVKKPQAPVSGVSGPEKAAAPPLPTPKPPPQRAEVKEKAKPAAEKPPVGTAGIKEEEMLRLVEDKMVHAIKEMLWEIVPPLAEKIINKEIDALKSEAEKSFKK
jgi:DNA-binding response OmpR family regulator